MNNTITPPPVSAKFFDGRTPRAADVFLRFMPDGFLLVCAAPEDLAAMPLLRVPRNGVAVDSRLAGTNRFVRLPDGAVCEVAGEHTALLDAAFDEWERAADACAFSIQNRKPKRQSSFLRRRLLYYLETSWRLVLAATALLAAATFALLYYGMPAAARSLAFALPDEAMRHIGQHTLETLDNIAFSPSKLPPARQRLLHERFDAFLRSAAATPSGAVRRVVFRFAPRIGANAFALPSGEIVFTDALVHLAANDDELLAVLAHECGHLEARHAVRSVIQTSFFTLLISFSAGDVTTATTLGNALPAFLVQNHFSRDFEREADAAAVRYLKTAGISPLFLCDILIRLETRNRGETENQNKTETSKTENRNSATDSDVLPDSPAWESYLNTHPATAERIRAIRETAAASNEQK